jgi:ATP-dependent helicase Lhr and Lhr-like helicase
VAVPSPPQSDALPRSTLVGEVDQIYADRLQPGDRFMLDGRCLEYRGRDGPALLVDEVVGRPQVPRWRGAGAPMSNELASRLYLFRTQAAEALRESPAALERLLRAEYRLNEAGAASLGRYLTRQETVSEIPDCGILLIECLANQACAEHYIHTPLPCPVNEALARVVTDRLRRSMRGNVVPMAADLGILIVLEGAGPIDPGTWRTLLAADGFIEDFALGLRESNLLRERFGRVAQTGLMVLRSPQGRAPKVGGKRWSVGPLFDQVRHAAPDFVLLRQAEREAADAACDLATALAFARCVPGLQIRQRRLTQPSPFADSLLAATSGPIDAASPEDAMWELQQALLDGAGSDPPGPHA